VAYMLKYGSVPALDSQGRPTMFFGTTVHDVCPLREGPEAHALGQSGCLEELGCRGPETRADCVRRRWNSNAQGTFGVNWCIGSRAPCNGCTESKFSELRPFYKSDD